MTVHIKNKFTLEGGPRAFCGAKDPKHGVWPWELRTRGTNPTPCPECLDAQALHELAAMDLE